MAIVRKYRDRWVADFRDQNGRRRIEAPKGPFETMALADSRIERDLKIDGVTEAVLYAAGVGTRPR